MRCLWPLIVASAVFAVPGCRPKGADEPASGLWLRVHCAGTARIAAAADSAKLREIAALPESAELRESLSRKLVTSFQQTLLRTTNAPSPDAADLLRPLFDEALTREFLFECHGRSNAPTTWLLAVALEGDLARRWETNYRALAARFNLGELKKFNARSFGGWHVTQPDKRIIDYLEVGKWVIVGLGTDRRPLAAALQRADKQGRPAPALGEAWLRAEGDLGRFSRALPLGDALTWPRVDLTVTARNTNLVATARFTFPKAWPLEVPAWNVPTNLAHDPVVSFTAARGIEGLVQGLPLYQRLALTNAPQQAFFWAKSQIPFESYVAAPLPGAGETLHEIARRLPLVLGTNMQRRSAGEIRWATNRVDLVWVGLPVVVPYLRTVKGPDGADFLFGGLFPQRSVRQPLPAELLAQLDRPALVYYDWEITEERLQQWRQLWQVWSLTTFLPGLENPVMHTRWLTALAPLLGNSVTEVTRTGPAELSVLRRSHVGLTAFELVVLARQVDELISGPARRAPLPTPGRPPGTP